MDANIQRSALGRSVQLGQVYDARRDEVLPVNLFKKDLTEDDIIEQEMNNDNFNLIESDTIENKLRKLNLDLDLGLSVLTGLVQMESSTCKYLNEDFDRAGTVQATLMCDIQTTRQVVDGIRGKLNKALLEDVKGTHVITDI